MSLFKYKKFTQFALVLAATVFSASSIAEGGWTYKVKITNITKGIAFTPVLASTHNHTVRLFNVGQAASDEVIRVAEGGDIGPLMDQLQASGGVYDVSSSEGLLNPGESLELTIQAKRSFRRLSLISMALPTNDTLVSLLNARVPFYRGSKVTRYMRAYDGGSEANTELCADIPGPHCGGEPFSDDDAGEGYIFPSAGIHGEADLSRAAYNWAGNVAIVEITRI